MCGRFTLRAGAAEMVEQFVFSFAAEDTAELQAQPRFNIAPTQDVLAIRAKSGGARVAEAMKWGLIPSWANDPSGGARLINARSETLAEKPSFRSAFERRRCLILGDGYYEWTKVGKAKQPYFFRMHDDRPFALAGLWEFWRGDGDLSIVSCSIVTTTPNSIQEPIHDRMPVILPPESYDEWLDPDNKKTAKLQRLLKPYDSHAMTVGPVARHVNSVHNDDPGCITPVNLGMLF